MGGLLSDTVNALASLVPSKPPPAAPEPGGLEMSLDDLFEEVCGEDSEPAPACEPAPRARGDAGRVTGTSNLIKVEFKPGGKRYTYALPPGLHAAVGDRVAVPAARTREVATVVAIGSAYTDPVRLVEAVIT
jgi:hypothetical protein